MSTLLPTSIFLALNSPSVVLSKRAIKKPPPKTPSPGPADQYLVAFDKTKDLTKHLEDLNAFITENAGCFQVPSKVLSSTNTPSLKLYSGVFDALVVKWIIDEKSKGVGVTDVDDESFSGPDGGSGSGQSAEPSSVAASSVVPSSSAVNLKASSYHFMSRSNLTLSSRRVPVLELVATLLPHPQQPTRLRATQVLVPVLLVWEARLRPRRLIVFRRPHPAPPCIPPVRFLPELYQGPNRHPPPLHHPLLYPVLNHPLPLGRPALQVQVVPVSCFIGHIHILPHTHSYLVADLPRALHKPPPKPEVAVPNAYLVAFDKTKDLTKHMEALKAFIKTSASCAKVQSVIKGTTNTQLLKSYSGVFDATVVHWIEQQKGANGVTDVAPDSWSKPDAVQTQTDASW